MQKTVGDGPAHINRARLFGGVRTVTRKPIAECNLAVSSMSCPHDGHREADRSSVVLDVFSERLRRLFITAGPTEPFDVFKDVFVDVCLTTRITSTAVPASSLRLQNVRPKRDASSAARFTTLPATTHLAKTSTRIPVLSP